jgi:hypothetical protein
MHYFYNDNFAETVVEENSQMLKGKGLDMKLAAKALKTFKFYHDHLKGLTSENKVFLLTENVASKAFYQQLDQSSMPFVMDVADYITAHKK